MESSAPAKRALIVPPPADPLSNAQFAQGHLNSDPTSDMTHFTAHPPLEALSPPQRTPMPVGGVDFVTGEVYQDNPCAGHTLVHGGVKLPSTRQVLQRCAG